MEDFSPVTAATVFVTYVAVDVLYALYVMAVGRRRALAAASISAILYSLLAYGVVTYSANILYLIPLACGAFVGTFLTVRWGGNHAS